LAGKRSEKSRRTKIIKNKMQRKREKEQRKNIKEKGLIYYLE